MISPSMIKGTMLVKAKQVKVGDDDYYFEFNLTEGQHAGLIAELLVAHVNNGTLTVKHDYESNVDEKIKLMTFLRETLEKYPDTPEQIKSDYMNRILSLSKEVQQVKA